MRQIVRWMMALVAVPVAFPVLAQRPAESVQPPIITASAVGKVQAVPDRAYVVLGVETRNASAAVAASENAAKQTSVISALRSLQISDSAISTQNYSVSPETRNDSGDHTPRIVSYLVSNSIQVEAYDLSKVGKLVDTALAHGANQIASITFFESNAEELYRQALAAAVANARAQAAAMAVAAGGRLGSLIDLNSQGGRFPSPALSNVRTLGFAADQTPVMPGQETIEASVSGRWVFIPER